MSEQIRVVPITEEQLKKFQDAAEAEAKQERDQLEAIRNFEPNELYDYLEDALITTDVIIESYNYTGIKTEISSVNYLGLTRLRNAIASAMTWMEAKYPEINPKNEEMPLPGASEDDLAIDLSEQKPKKQKAETPTPLKPANDEEL